MLFRRFAMRDKEDNYQKCHGDIKEHPCAEQTEHK